MYEAIRGNTVPWGQAEVVYRQTEGNPLFVQEVLRYLVEGGIVYREGVRYQAREEDAGAAEVIPEGLRDVVGRRLNRLGPRANQVLSIASVIGRDFQLEVLRRVTDLPEDELLESLEEAVERAIVEERSDVAADVRYRFTHAFFRQALYEEILAARRIRWHGLVARALESVFPGRLDEHAAELAEHYSHSSDFDDLRSAVDYSRAAAMRALSVHAYGEAVKLLQQAIDLQEVIDPNDHDVLVDLLLALGDALIPAGDPIRATEYAAAMAYSHAEALQDSRRAFEACRIGLDAGLVFSPAVLGLSPEWLTWLERAESHATISDAASVRFMRAKVVFLMNTAHAKEAAQLADEALLLARGLKDPDAEFSIVWEALAVYRGSPARDIRKSLALAEEYARRAKEGVSALNLALFTMQAAITFLACGLRGRLDEVRMETRALADRTKYPRLLAVDAFCEVLTASVDGRYEDAEKASARLDAMTEASGQVQGVVLTLRALCQLS